MPIPTGSVVDLTVEAARPTSAEEINAAFAERADRAELEGILQYSDDPIVSSDIVASPYSAVLAWYDNEWGYATRLTELAQRVHAPVPERVARRRPLSSA